MDPTTERAILRCLEPDPTRRPASAKAVAAALPGGDPLAAAIAAGETPSPEMVAAAGEIGALRPAIAWAMLVATAIAAVIMVLFWGRHQITGYTDLPKEPAVLVAEAREILEAAGKTEEPVDEAWGFRANNAYLRFLEDEDDPARWDRLGTGPNTGIFFWYRTSPWPLRPVSFLSHRASPYDPQTIRPGMTIVWLDPEGRLAQLETVPPELASEGGGGAERKIAWGVFLDAAGLEDGGLRSVEPRWNPPMYAESRVAWEVNDSRAEEPGLRIEGASFAGLPVYFRLIAPWERSADEGSIPMTAAERAVSVVGAVVFVCVMLGGLLLAMRNARLGRSDLKGAFRITAVFVVVHMAGWILWSKHVWTTDALMSSFFMNLAMTLFEGLTLYMMYLAVEPFVRRRWPDSIISWSRLMAGRFRDPLIGRDLLFGSLIGVALGILALFDESLPGWLGDTPGRPAWTDLSSLGGVRLVVGEVLDEMVHAIAVPMVMLVFFLLLLVMLKRQWAAAVAVLLLVGGMASAGADYWYDVPLVVAFVALMLFTVLRLGLVAAVVANAVSGILLNQPITADLSVWWSGPTMAVLAVLSLFSVYGFVTSLGGRSPFGEGLLGDET
jgi:serine/threonine-protein kinase